VSPFAGERLFVRFVRHGSLFALDGARNTSDKHLGTVAHLRPIVMQTELA
jgi:hypothetical protein